MTLIKRSDVKNHLSTRANKVLFPFKPASGPDAIGSSESEPRDTKPRIPNSGDPSEIPTAKKP
jgi:hypothetical protein